MTDAAEPEPKGFPFITTIATLITLFAFLGLIFLAYNSPNYLGESKAEPKVDPATKLSDVKARNKAALDALPGSGAKMPVSEASAQLLGKLKSDKDTLPFPMPEPPAPPVLEPKK